MKNNKLVAIIPFYNNQNDFETIKTELVKIAPKKSDFILVDNGSIPPIFEYEFNIAPNIHAIRLPLNLGYGGAIKFAVKRNPEYSHYAWIPGNQKISIHDFIQWLEMIDLSFLYVKGKRVRNLKDMIWARIAEYAVFLSTGIWIPDMGGVPCIVSNEKISLLFRSSDDVSFDSILFSLFKRDGVAPQRIQIKYGNRVYGNSTWNNGLRSQIKLLKRIINIIKNS